MAYADAFDPTQPPGGQAIALGDDAIRKLARSIQQRLNTLMNFDTSTDPIADPVKLLAGAISASAMIGNLVVDTAQINNNAVNTAKLLDGAVTMAKIDPAAHIKAFFRCDGVVTKDPFNNATSWPVDTACPGVTPGMAVYFSWSTAPGALMPQAYGRVDVNDVVKVVFENQTGVVLHVVAAGFKLLVTP